jgi:hypothetical protein
MDAGKRKSLETLRQDLRACFPDATAHEALSFKEGKIPRGAITEVSGTLGSGRTELVLQFLSEHPELRVAWIEEELSIYPCAFPQHGVGMERVLFVDAGPEALACAYQVLSSQIFEVVVLNARIQEEVALKRFQFAAEKAGVCLLLLSEQPRREGAWPITLQIEVSRAREKLSILNDETRTVHIHKNRGGSVWRSTG